MQPGQLILSRYRIVSQLGSGGFGETYLAEDTHSNQQVAIKRINPALTQTPALVAQFKKEAKILERINHPHLIRYIAFEVENQQHYLITNFISGQNLHDLVESGYRFSEAEGIRVALAILSGLKHTHRLGVIHRDVKPANIMLDNNVPVLIDFGIARSSGLGGPTQSIIHSAVSPYFGAPEQQLGQHPTTKVDIYSVGVTLYHLITGNALVVYPLWPMARLQIDDTPNPLPDISRPLSDVITKATSVNPNDRYDNVEAMIQALQGLLPNAAINPPVQQRGINQPNPIPPSSTQISQWLIPVIVVVAALALMYSFGIIRFPQNTNTQPNSISPQSGLTSGWDTPYCATYFTAGKGVMSTVPINIDSNWVVVVDAYRLYGYNNDQPVVASIQGPVGSLQIYDGAICAVPIEYREAAEQHRLSVARVPAPDIPLIRYP